jgi:hypothetical protein
MLAIMDDRARECLMLVADTSLSGVRVGRNTGADEYPANAQSALVTGLRLPQGRSGDAVFNAYLPDRYVRDAVILCDMCDRLSLQQSIAISTLFMWALENMWTGSDLMTPLSHGAQACGLARSTDDGSRAEVTTSDYFDAGG